MKHGDSADCGSTYTVDEATRTAVCPHCGARFERCLDAWPRGAIVRYTAKALKSLFGQGGRGAPIDGRIVGATDGGTWPIVQWRSGVVGPVAAGAIERRAS